MATLVVPRHDCGFVGKPTTPGMADYSLRKHSCDKHRRAAAAKANRLALEAAVNRTPKPCLHKQANHQHGTHSCYVLDRCRCWPCARANTAYEGRRSRQTAYGRWQPYIDAGPAVAHVRELMAAGIGIKQITKLSGVSAGVLWKLLYGKLGPDGVRRPSTKIRQETADRLLAIRPGQQSLAGGAYVDATGTRRRLQALVTIGWSQSKLGVRLGDTTGSNFGQLLQRDQVTKATAEKAAKVYDELWNTPPAQSAHHDKAAATRARNYARRHGWAPPLAWDEDTIDDPTAVPAIDAEPREGQLDEVAVARIMAGTLLLVPRVGAHGGTPPELVEAIRRLAGANWSDAEIGRRIGMTRDAVLQQRKRNDISSNRNNAREPIVAIAPDARPVTEGGRPARSDGMPAA